MEAHYGIYATIAVILLGLMFLTVPVFMSLFFTGLIGWTYFGHYPAMMMAQALFRSMDKFALVVVLYFILCGNIMTRGSIVDRLVKVANVTVGWLPGGLGMVGVLACGLFGAISGSTVATVVAIGGFMIPALLENGYDEKYTVGIMTTSPILGIIIPPSISMILYAMISNDSLEALFMTGFVPGILIIIFFSLYSYYVAKKRNFPLRPRPSFKEFIEAYKEGMWALFLPVIICGGIFSGMFTANEAAVIASVYAFIVELFIYKDITWKDVFSVTASSAVTSATLLIIVAGATCFGKYLTIQQIPAIVTEAVVSHIHTKWAFLLVINIILLIVGTFMDIISATLILTPIFLPMLYQFGVNSLHFGLLMTVNLGIGYCTPPLGVSLFITGAMVKRDILYVTKAVMPFIILQLIILGILTYMPKLVLFLPKLAYGAQVVSGGG